ncbi:MAG: sigma-70 family RNA polymerase sigma factor [Deltaproteobacteria bacterium]|nr:sigma-70 family RNA polymerase sigma factor [Deltaproteobacteria bacterium]
MGSKYPCSDLEIYTKRVRDYPILTREEELRLVRTYRNGDIEAGKKIITSNLRFVMKVSHSYFHFGYSPLEIIQEGNMGLVKALIHFDPDRGVRFISYAIWWIKAYINNFIHKNYQSHTGRLSHAKGLISLDCKYIKNEHEDGTILDHILNESPDQETYYGMKEQAIFVSSFLKANPPMLTSREIFVIQQRFFSDPPATLNDIAIKIGVTRERVRQIEVRSLKRLRTAIETHHSMVPADIESFTDRVYNMGRQRI